MKSIPICVLVLSVLLTRPVLAEEPSAADLYHEAYVLEVIEGDVKGAAKRYLGLTEHESVPADIRAASRLRFAICTVLMGRPDEARLQLQQLLSDAALPIATRERAQRYLESISELGAGSEFERKLQSLVFDLARVDPAANEPPAYRDFEVLGERTLPFLRELLQHADRSLARHAFRLLMRMDEPGLGAAWTPRIGLPGQAFMREWIHVYLGRRPEEVAAWETTLGSLDDRDLRGSLSLVPRHMFPAFSLGFIEMLAKDRANQALAVRFLTGAGDEASRWALRERWLDGDDEDLASRAAVWILEWTEGGPTDEGARRRWPRVLKIISHQSHGWSPTSAQRESRSANLLAYLRRLPTPSLLDSLDSLLTLGLERAEGDANPLTNGLASSVGEVLDGRDLEPGELERYGLALRRWVEIWRARAGEPSRSVYAWKTSREWLRRHLVSYIEDVDEDEAKAFLTFLFEGPARQYVADFSGLIHGTSARAFSLLAHAVAVVAPSEREVLLRRVPPLANQKLSSGTRDAILRALPTFYGLAGASGVSHHLAWVANASRLLTAEEKRAIFRQLLLAARARSAADVTALLGYFGVATTPNVQFQKTTYNYFVEAVLPVLDEDWDALPSSDREEMLERAWRIQSQGPPAVRVGNHMQIAARDGLTGENAERLRAFLRKHLPETPAIGWKSIAAFPEVAPAESWVPLVPIKAINSIDVSEMEADRVAFLLTQEIDQVADSVLVFVLRNASEAVQQNVFDRALKAGNPELRRRAIGWLNYKYTNPAGDEALEVARQAILAEAEKDFEEVSDLLSLLRKRSPSAGMFPLVRILLGGDTDQVMQGIAHAKDLGQDELVRDLVPFLDSMNKPVREAARDAIQAIREVARVKNEELLRAAGHIPR